MLTRFIAKAALVAPAFGLLGCASFPSNYGLDDGSATMVRQTCQEIMGLKVGPELEACGGSLADTVRSLQDARMTARADQSCEQQGLTRGTAEHAKCVVTSRRSPERIDATSLQLAAVPHAQPWQSYFSMSQAQQDERAELSCAQLGLHPAVGGFWSCVSDLKYSIANVRYETMP
ncbi:MAG TPA: hypothetical protein VGD45_12965 [Steroidobacter sp.]|uniref:hypothetical protein n=1 Tax=Steroidobacter sp. TaxID=1978227 RepID=UPI002EDB23C9